jgi:hypothetical protein
MMEFQLRNFQVKLKKKLSVHHACVNGLVEF